MARNTLVINCDLRETRVALIEDGVIAELHIERANARGAVGNVVLGKVTRVLPGMQAAFIDVGMDRAAFLHVEDLIRPDDFEAYLAGAHREDEGPSGKGEGGRRRHGEAGGEDDEDDDEVVVGPGEGNGNGEVAAAPAEAQVASVPEVEPAHEDAEDEDEDEDEGEDEDDADDGDSDPEASDEEAGPDAEDAEEGEADEPSAAAAAAPSAEVAEGAEASSQVENEPPPAGAAVEESTGRLVDASRRGGRRRRRRRGRAPEPKAAPGRRESARGGKNKGGSPKKPQLRVARTVPITEVVKEGDEVVVQISKEPIGTKGARVTSHISLPGRYVVYLPTVEHTGVSKRIGSGRERHRLREVIDSVKPQQGGLIVRTVAEGLTKKQLKADIGYLIKLWAEIARNREGARSPKILYSELDIVLRTARDLFTDEIEHIVIDDREQYLRLVRFVEMFLPARVKDIELYTGPEPIFDAYGIEDEIGRALSRKVPLASGGYLIIDQAEALTAIDVNTGRFVGKGSKDLEETALKTNLEAVEEIAYQLRFRNIGGLVILDLIDMEIAGNRDKVWRALEAALAKDKAKTTLNRISELGLIEMTRKRTRESLSRTMNEPCFYCDGTGHIQSRTTIAYEILRQIRRERDSLPGYVITVNAHPAVVDLLTTEEKAAVQDAERRYMRRIELTPRREYHIEQFDLQGR
ncbi:MAG: Rne/Rng family ribonuclease [Polyangiaceae bacterium]|nr:Rne/Rng family ribonuclease [Polyangiaceae bacterium]MCL4753419.1 Rne/Rng family ribonuclease [Myxococcales bacterium]